MLSETPVILKSTLFWSENTSKAIVSPITLVLQKYFIAISFDNTIEFGSTNAFSAFP